jgi:hypothetical protein
MLSYAMQASTGGITVYAQALPASGAATSGVAGIAGVSSPNNFVGRPSIVHAGSRWLVAWLQAGPGNNHTEEAIFVDNRGVKQSVFPTDLPVGGNFADQSSPRVAWDGTRFLTSWFTGPLSYGTVTSTDNVFPQGDTTQIVQSLDSSLGTAKTVLSVPALIGQSGAGIVSDGAGRTLLIYPAFDPSPGVNGQALRIQVIQ